MRTSIFIQIAKLCICFAIVVTVTAPAYAEYYIVSSYYPDTCCCCNAVYVKKKVRRIRHHYRRHTCSSYTYQAPTMMEGEYAWVPDPWDP